MNGRARAVVALSAVLVVVAMILGAARLWTYIGDRSETDRRLTSIAEQNHEALAKTDQAVQILLSVTGPDAQAKQAAGTIDILKRNAVELDCRSRRQQARLAAPDPARPCVDQTPADVFPGIDGSPTRGAP